MKNKQKKMSLADFKAKSANVSIHDVLDKIKGGTAQDCHFDPMIKII